jgi:hypothetical protein
MASNRRARSGSSGLSPPVIGAAEPASGSHRDTSPERRDQIRERRTRPGAKLEAQTLGHIARDRTQRVHERRVRKDRAAELQAASGEHPGAIRHRARLELADEPALAHPGLARDEHERRDTGGRAGERRIQDRQLGRPADEGGARDAAGHDLHDGLRRRLGPPRWCAHTQPI